MGLWLSLWLWRRPFGVVCIEPWDLKPFANPLPDFPVGSCGLFLALPPRTGDLYLVRDAVLPNGARLPMAVGEVLAVGEPVEAVREPDGSWTVRVGGRPALRGWRFGFRVSFPPGGVVVYGLGREGREAFFARGDPVGRILMKWRWR